MSALVCIWFAPVVLPLIAAMVPSFDGRKRVTFRKSNGQRVTFYKLVTR